MAIHETKYGVTDLYLTPKNETSECIIDVQHPDPDWKYTDAQGHVHKWIDSKTPSLKTKMLNEEDLCPECERWTGEYISTKILVCKLCGEAIEPKYTYSTKGVPVKYNGHTNGDVTVDLDYVSVEIIHNLELHHDLQMLSPQLHGRFKVISYAQIGSSAIVHFACVGKVTIDNES